jgi:hypothetical protein
MEIFPNFLPPWAIPVTIAIIVALLLTKFYRRLHPGRIYFPAPSLLTPAERKFLNYLEHLIVSELRLDTKVRLADLVQVRARLGQQQRRAFGQIAQKHIDFCLSHRKNGQIIAAIELDDRSHQRPDRQHRDRLINAVCQQAEIPLLRFPANCSTQYVRNNFPQNLTQMPPAPRQPTHYKPR